LFEKKGKIFYNNDSPFLKGGRGDLRLMKKSHKNALANAGLLFLALIFLGGVYFFTSKNSTQKEDEKQKVFIVPAFQRGQIKFLQIYFYDQTNHYKSRLENVSNEWQMVYPLKDKADEESVNRILNDLMALKSEMQLTNVSADQIKNYGFGDPVGKIVIHLEDGKEISVVSGKKTAVGDYYYTMANSITNPIYLVYYYKFASLEKKPGELRNKEIFTIPLASIKVFEIKPKGQEAFTFESRVENKESVFYLTHPVSAKADYLCVKGKILEFYAMSILDFPEAKKQNPGLAFYGLNPPYYLARMISADGLTNELNIGKEESQGVYYACVNGRKEIVLIEIPDLTNKFSIRLFDLTSGKTNG
jgi:hypothetical protein